MSVLRDRGSRLAPAVGLQIRWVNDNKFAVQFDSEPGLNLNIPLSYNSDYHIHIMNLLISAGVATKSQYYLIQGGY